MKNKYLGARFSFIGYLLFLMPVVVIVSLAIVLFNCLLQVTSNLLVIGGVILGYILLVTLWFCLIDIVRRKIMIDKPVFQILNATQKIAKGDFNVALVPLHTHYKYDQFDLIIENINKMTSELSKSEILKTEFISNVSHEIKTPLMVIQSYAKAFQSEKIDEQTRIKYLQIIASSTQKLSNLITNILKLNKLENQSITPEKQQVNVEKILTEIILQYENLFESKNITLDVDISNITLLSDESCLEIIFTNLISNAIKFTDINGKIYISLKQDGLDVVFKIVDNGCGMSSEIGNHIFEKFYQGDTSHSAEGNGLGLPLVKKVIDILGGEISVKSQEGKGSEFVVRLKNKENNDKYITKGEV